MKNFLDKLNGFRIINKKLLIFLIIIIIVGLTSGSIFTLFLNDSDKEMTFNELSLFFNNVVTNKLNYFDCFKNSYSNSMFYLTIIWILGVSLFGAIFIIPILYFKSFILGFTISSIIANYGFKGVLISIFYVIPHLVINLLVFTYISLFAITLSIRMIKGFIGKKTVDFKLIFNKYMIIFLLGLVILLFTSLYETFIMPLILSVFKGLIM